MRNIVQWSGASVPPIFGRRALARITRVALLLAIALMLATTGVRANDNPKPSGYTGTQEQWDGLGIGGQKKWHNTNVSTQELFLAAAQALLAEIQEDLDSHIDEHGELPDLYDWLTSNDAPPKPKLEDYESLEEYGVALSAWWASLPAWAAANGLEEMYELVRQQHVLRLLIRDAEAAVEQASDNLEAAIEDQSDHCTTHQE